MDTRRTTRQRSPSAPPSLHSQAEEEYHQPQVTNTAVTEELFISHLEDFRTEVQTELTAQLALQDQRLQAFEERITALLSKPAFQQPSPPVTTTPVTARQTPPNVRLSQPLSSNTETYIKTDPLRAADFPKFTADTSSKNDIDDWIEQVDAIYEFSGATEAQILKLLPVLLQGRALEWFTGLGTQRHHLTTWAQWKDALINAFRAPNFMEQLRVKLTRRRLKDDESFAEYYQDKLQMINKYYGERTANSIKIEELMTGIPVTMHALIRTAKGINPTTEEFRRTLMELEPGLKAQHVAQKPRQPQNNSQARTQSAQGDRPNPRQQSSRPPTTTTTVIQQEVLPKTPCFKCGKMGHWSRDCTTPTRPQNSQQSWRNPSTNTNSVKLPYNRYKSQRTEVDPVATEEPTSTTWENLPTVNALLTRAKAKGPSTPSPEPEVEEPLAHITSAPSKNQVQRLVPYQDPKRVSIPHYLDKTPAFSNLWLNAKPIKHRACIDSGSSISLIDEAYLAKHLPEVKPQPCSNFIIQGLGMGSHAWSFVDLDAAFKASDLLVIPVRFYISPFSHTKIIIGNDVLHAHGAVIDFKNQSFTLGNKTGERIPFQSLQVVPPGHTNASVSRTKQVHNAEAQLFSEADRQDINTFLDTFQHLAIFNTALDDFDQAKVVDVLIKNRLAFAYGDRKIGKTSMVKLHLDTGNSPPINLAPYHASPKGRQIIEEQTNEELQLGIIERITSPWNAPIILVKQGEKYRKCTDLRQFNELIVSNGHPMRRTDDILNSFSGKKWFSSFDANKGFHQIEVAEEDQHKLAFSTHMGQFCYKRMPFGIKTGPAVFQQLADTILGSSTWNHALAYIDDIIVFSDTLEDHLLHLDTVLKKIIKSGLTLSIKKSNIAMNSIQALGHTISNLGIGTAPANVQAILEFPRPTTVKELQRFLGMCVYYRKFIKSFAAIAGPLHELTKKDAKFEWTEAKEQAFNTLKQHLMTPPILAHPDFTKPFILFTDASNTGLGAILSQLDGEGREVNICYISRTLSAPEKNYSPTELECLAAVWSIKKLHAFLDGSKFKLVTDHSALQWLKNFKGNNRRLANWILQLEPYKEDMEIVYKPGRTHSNVDPLSRAAIPFIPEEVESNHIYTIDINTLPEELHQNIPQLYQADTYFTAILKDLKSGQPPPHLKDYMLKDNLIWRHNPYNHGQQLCIPDDKTLKTSLLQDYHDAPLAGHLGRHKTLMRLVSTFWWPNITKDVKDYVESCIGCQRNKASNAHTRGLLNPLPTPPARWHTVTMDFTGPFPINAEGKDMLMVVIDKFSKRAHFIPCRSTDKAPDIALLFFRNIVRLHGLPQVIVCDRDSKFTSLFWDKLFKTMGVKIAMSTAFHPQTDGQTERLNRTIKEMLRQYISYKQIDWADHLDVLEFAYNDSIHASTGYTPFELDTGFHPHSPLRFSTTLFTDAPVSTQDFASKLQEDAVQAQEAMAKAQLSQARHHNLKRQDVSFEPGALVKLSAKHVHPDWIKQCPSKKLLPKFYGPYKVIRKVSNNSYELDLPQSMKIHRVINAEYLAPFKTTPQHFEGRLEPAPPPVQVDGEEEFVIDSILDTRLIRGKPHYLVHWKGSDVHDNTWLPLSEVDKTVAYDHFLKAQEVMKTLL